MEPVLKILLAYLLGSVNGSLALGRLRGVDIRTQGSGNAGGTNALRTQGPAFALAVVVIDVLKGWVAVRLLPGAQSAPWLGAACGFAAIAGHVWPVFHGFRGGKGVATLVGAVAGLSLPALGAVIAVWLAMVMLFGFVGLASIVAAVTLPHWFALLRAQPLVPLLSFGVASAVLVVWTHRGNIARMRRRVEPRARRLWLLGRLRNRGAA
jgi:glycerol-3-phosphate acyltransferase PlsY